jgi:hypothetical protein
MTVLAEQRVPLKSLKPVDLRRSWKAEDAACSAVVFMLAATKPLREVAAAGRLAPGDAGDEHRALAFNALVPVAALNRLWRSSEAVSGRVSRIR